MHAVLKGTTRMVAAAGMTLSLLLTAACDDDDPVEPSVPTTLTIEGGNNQQIAMSTQSAPLTVMLVDQNGDPLAGRTVTWAIATGTGTLANQTSVTDSNGEATMTVTSGSSPGAVAVTATVSGLTPVTFNIMVQ